MIRGLALALTFAASLAWAQPADNRPEPMLPDPALEARARELAKTIRCLVCQNQSIEDSNADLARDLRVVVRERVAAGDDDDKVRAYLVSRYGDWVLLKPPFNLRTAALWAGPAVLFLLASWALVVYFRRRPTTTPAPLTKEERAKLVALMRSDGEGKR
ncbi:MAG: cytochrome c-type biogenesis protein CcmH [Alphaproteobacteria bacterium]|nr:cytochrome c-type biogenesis protein CcmH [Alphaproteobacteria bacterium]